MNHTWQDITVKNMITEIAERNGFKAAVANHFDSFTVNHYLQQGQSDADLAKEQAEQYSATFKTTNDRLVFIEQGADTTARGQAQTPVPLATADKVKGRLQLKGSPTYEGVKAFWYDIDTAQRHELNAFQSILDMLYSASSDYGRSVLRPFIWLISSIGLFFLTYWNLASKF